MDRNEKFIGNKKGLKRGYSVGAGAARFYNGNGVEDRSNINKKGAFSRRMNRSQSSRQRKNSK